MREVFTGRQRKLGVLTLLMACVFAMGWVRSTFIWDDISYATGATSAHAVGSLDRHLVWVIFRDVRPTLLPESLEWSTGPCRTIDGFYKDESKTWNWRFFGFVVGESQGPGKVTIFIVSYWLIIIPLTLLSAYLLLSKPLRRAPPTPSRPLTFGQTQPPSR